MSFKNRREYLFVYSVKDANPNGDPLNANHPRYDDDSSAILVSDVRIKRTVRDQWLREGKDVFVDGEVKTLASRVKELRERFCAATGEKVGKKAGKDAGKASGKDALKYCIDTRLFGVTFALGKESFSWTGPVQFKWGRSLHKASVMMIQGTAAFAKDESSEQRSFRNEYIVPFALIADYGIANQYASEKTGATDDDLEALFKALWSGTCNLITRSKIGHTPRLLIEIKYADGFSGAIGAMDEKISIKDLNGAEMSADAQMAIRGCGEIILDASKLCAALEKVKDEIEAVRIIKDMALNIGELEKIKSLLGGKVSVEMR